MPRKRAASQHNDLRDDLRELIPAALQAGKARKGTKRTKASEGNAGASALETYLTENSALPGPRMNLELVNAFADVVGEIIEEPDPPVEQIEQLLDGWAGLPIEAAPVNDPREILPAVAAMSYGQAAVSRPDWWEDEIAKLRRAATDPRWRIHEIVATALQRMLEADWTRTCETLYGWLHEDDLLLTRAAVAAVAEPRLLTDDLRGMNALSLQAFATGCLSRIPADDRRDEEVRTLRQALGYTLSVVVVAVPDPGFALLERLAASDDKDVRWIVRENLKKARLKPWAERVETLQALLAA
jgi:hypothetical protein